MEFNYKLCGLMLLILSLAQVSRAQLKCYVCENCAQVSTTTPLLNCDEDFFNGGGSNEPSTQTTTAMPSVTTEMPTEMPSTSSTTSDRTSTVSTTESTTTSTTAMSTTESAMPPHTTTDETTTENNATSTSNSSSTSTNAVSSTTSSSASPPTTTEQNTVTTDSTMHLETTTTAVTEGMETTATNTTGNMESNSTLTSISTSPVTSTSTEQQPPTPSTAHPSSSIPTPPNPSAAIPVDDIGKYVVNGTEADHASTKPYIVSSQFRLRQSRAVSDYTYHCFKVTASANGSMATNRGCSRVKTTESVCGQWKVQHPTEQLNKCHPCSNTRCNGSTALNLSLGALALTLVAAALQRK